MLIKVEFKINDLQGAQNISRKILKITTRYYLTVKLDAVLLMYFTPHVTSVDEWNYDWWRN